MRPVESFDQMGTSVGEKQVIRVGKKTSTQSLTIEEDLKGSTCEQLAFDGVG